MLKRDSLTAQMQQLSQVLAKVKRLIIEDTEDEARGVTFAIFMDYYQLDDRDLLILPESEFIEKVRSKNLQPEEVNMLAYFLDEYAGLQEELSSQLHLYTKYLLLVAMLEDEYQFVSLEHIARKNLLEKQLSQINRN